MNENYPNDEMRSNDPHTEPDRKKMRVPLTEAVITLILVVVIAMVVWWPSPESASATNAVLNPAEDWTTIDPIEPLNQDLWTVDPDPQSGEPDPQPTVQQAETPTTVVVQQAVPDPAVEQKLDELSKLTDSQTRAMAQLLGDLEAQRRAQQQQAETIQRLTEALSKAAAEPEPEQPNEADQAYRQQMVEALFDLKATLDHAQQRAQQNESKLTEMGQRLAEFAEGQKHQEAQTENDEADEPSEMDQAAQSIAELRMHLDTARRSEVAQWQDLHKSISTLESKLASLAERIDESSKPPSSTPAVNANTSTNAEATPRDTVSQTQPGVDEDGPANSHTVTMTRVVIALLNGRYDDATEYFSKAHRQRVTADGIADAMGRISDEAGRFAGIVSRQELPMQLGEGTVAYRVVVKTTYHKRVSFTITIGPSGKIDSLFARVTNY